MSHFFSNPAFPSLCGVLFIGYTAFIGHIFWKAGVNDGQYQLFKEQQQAAKDAP